MCEKKDFEYDKYYSDKYPSGPWSRYLWQVMRGYYDEDEFKKSSEVDKSHVEER